ncbi:MAG: serine/threonine-protein kinase, partial [Frankia sp.]
MSSPLGRGGMGAVWRATDELLHREVAIKEILVPNHLPADELELIRRRSLREARAAAGLNHPALITVHDVVLENGQPSIVMEFVPARSLQELVHQHGPMPPARAAGIALAVLSGLATAHRAGILHRDVKPSNILLGDNGRVVLTDFGLARFATETSSPLTMPGQVLGTPGYIAPETARGELPAGPQSDLWSLGATLYTMVEGHPPYPTETFHAWLAGVVADAPPPPQRAGALGPLITGLMERDPAARLDIDGAIHLLRSITAQAESRTVVASDPAGLPLATGSLPEPRRREPPAETAGQSAGQSAGRSAGQSEAPTVPAATRPDRRSRGRRRARRALGATLIVAALAGGASLFAIYRDQQDPATLTPATHRTPSTPQSPSRAGATPPPPRSSSLRPGEA